MYPLKKAQIAYLKIDKGPTNIPSKYAHFVHVFLPKLAIELLKYTSINNHIIKLVDNSQLPYTSIYNLD